MVFKKKAGLIYSIAVLVFIVLSIILIFKHEPWRDEAQAWLIARDTPNIASMIKEMGYEGTPALWPIMLLSLQKLGLPYFSMFVLHFILALLGVVIFLKYSSFPAFEKILFIFGYYIFYEYNIIARSYVLTVLFLFIIASMYKYRFEKPILFSSLIFLLSNSNAHGFVLAIVLSFIFIIEMILTRIKFNKKIILSIIIIAVGFFLVVCQLIHPKDLQPNTADWKFDLNFQRIGDISQSVTAAFIPIPNVCITFWNSMLLLFPTYIYLGLLIYIATIMYFIRHVKYMIIYILLSFSLFSIFYIKSGATVRHFGYLFIVFIFTLWISDYYNNNNEKKSIKNKYLNKIYNRKILNRLLIGSLVVQIITSAIAFYFEYKYDFSASKKTAEYLVKEKYINEKILIATYLSYAASSALPYLPKSEKFYSLEYKKFGSYIVWNKEYFNNRALNSKLIIDRIDNALRRGHFNKTLLILNGRLDKDGRLLDKFKLIKSFDKTIVGDESLYIYKLKEKI